ncbi:MAG: tetratricopeptide repeat protein [Nitrospirota bacterium]
MLIANRFIFLFAACAILISSIQPAWAQGENADLQRGIAEFRQENFEEAIDSLTKAYNSEPASSLPAYYLGMTYKNLQNYKAAKKYFVIAIDLSPKIKELYLELAEVNYQLGELQGALDILKKAESENVRPGQTAYLKGLVLLAMNRNLDAVESFRVSGESGPELVQASDYQTGLAYLNEGMLEEAAARFNAVISRDPDSDMAVFARNYLEKIPAKKREQSPIRYYLGLHFQYDDNVVLRPGDETAAENISDEEDFLEVATAGVEYFPQMKGPVGIEAHYSFYYSRHHDLESYDVHSHSFFLVPNYRINEGSKVSLAVGYGYMLVDDDKYLAAGSISPTYTLLINKSHTLQTYFTYQKKEYLLSPANSDEDRDADEYSFNFNWVYFFAQDMGSLIPFKEKFDLSSFSQNKGYFNFHYKISKEDTDGINWDYIGSKLTLTTLVPLHEKVKLSVSGDADYRNFKNAHTVYNEERRDISYGASALLFYRFLKYADVQFLYAYRSYDSNITLYDYERNLFSIGVEMRY